MERTKYLSVQSNGGSEVSVRLTKKGRCELVFESLGNKNSYPCSLSSLINVGLGARTHLASDFGSVALTRTPGGVKISMTPWGYDQFLYFVPMDVYANALSSLSAAHSIRDKVSLR